MRQDGNNAFIRREVENILARYGHTVYAVVANRAIRCSCFDEATHESDPSCVKCFGLGYHVALHRLLTYSRSQTPPAWGNFGATQVESPGIVQAGGRYFYFASDVFERACPVGGDLILEPRYDGRGRVTGLSAVYAVSQSEAYRCGDGSPAYYRVACHLESSDITSRETAFLAHLSRRG